MDGSSFHLAPDPTVDDFFSRDSYKTRDPRSSNKWTEQYFAEGFGVSEEIFRDWYIAYSISRGDGASHETSLAQVPMLESVSQSLNDAIRKKWWAHFAHIKLKKSITICCNIPFSVTKTPVCRKEPMNHSTASRNLPSLRSHWLIPGTLGFSSRGEGR